MIIRVTRPYGTGSGVFSAYREVIRSKNGIGRGSGWGDYIDIDLTSDICGLSLELIAEYQDRLVPEPGDWGLFELMSIDTLWTGYTSRSAIPTLLSTYTFPFVRRFLTDIEVLYPITLNWYVRA